MSVHSSFDVVHDRPLIVIRPRVGIVEGVSCVIVIARGVGRRLVGRALSGAAPRSPGRRRAGPGDRSRSGSPPPAHGSPAGCFSRPRCYPAAGAVPARPGRATGDGCRRPPRTRVVSCVRGAPADQRRPGARGRGAGADRSGHRRARAALRRGRRGDRPGRRAGPRRHARAGCTTTSTSPPRPGRRSPSACSRAGPTPPGTSAATSARSAAVAGSGRSRSRRTAPRPTTPRAASPRCSTATRWSATSPGATSPSTRWRSRCPTSSWRTRSTVWSTSPTGCCGPPAVPRTRSPTTRCG